MFGFRPKLPVTEDERIWVDTSLTRLAQLLGRERMLNAEVILPRKEYFPDLYDGTPAGMDPLFRRVCQYMGVDPNRIEVEIFPDHEEQIRRIAPLGDSRSHGPAGLFTSTADASRTAIAVKSSQLKDPMALVATLAHELGHVILLGGGLVDREAPDMEPLTDLVTVYLGLGIFSANSAARFEQHSDGQMYGWSMRRLGYLSEEVYGYALAAFAQQRSETRPAWAKHLTTNVKAYFNRSRSWLKRAARNSINTTRL